VMLDFVGHVIQVQVIPVQNVVKQTFKKKKKTLKKPFN